MNPIRFAAAGLFIAAVSAPAPVRATVPGEGALLTLEGAPCPLKHTSVKAEISGPLARVTVTQEFTNPSEEAIEAVYVFPLPQNSAVDDMTMRVGERIVKGAIKRREEAQAIFDAARAAGRTAALLEQERPNIFTQSVTNIAPRASVKITISYVELMPYEAGEYAFVFPMVVGPRYMPRSVQDAGRIAPPVTPKGTRTGHDVSLEVAIDAGLPVDDIRSSSHQIDVISRGGGRATVVLKQLATIPNKDFVLRYGVAGRKISDALLAHHGARGGFFTLILQPPEIRPLIADITPKELVFVLDTSGSMNGFPIEKAKETMRLALAGLHPQDTFNLITFAGDTEILFPEPVPATAANLARAQEFLASRSGRGGTEMMKAIRAALEPSESQRHVRVVCFMTDGFVGNDYEILDHIRRNPNARVFSFGIGSSVNRYLLDKMARYGRGEVEYVSLSDDGSAAAQRFYQRVRDPILTDIRIEWGGLPVTDVYPERIPDLFSAKPVIVTGRYTGAASGVVRLRGRVAGRETVREIPVTLPAAEKRHDVLATLWARSRVEELMSQDLIGMQHSTTRTDVREQITQVGLDYKLMTPFTSFVAVEEVVVNDEGRPRRIEVPVEMPEGVSYEGVFGDAVGVARAGFAMESRFAPAMAQVKLGRRIEMQVAGSPPLAAPVQGRLHPSLEGRRSGTVEVQVWVTDTSAQAVADLKKLGFEVLVPPRGQKLFIGRIRAEKLAELARLPFVRYVAPQGTPRGR